MFLASKCLSLIDNCDGSFTAVLPDVKIYLSGKLGAARIASNKKKQHI